MTLKETFSELLKNYSIEGELVTKLWNEIEVRHSEKHRFYHSLTHLENLLKELKPIQYKIENYNAVLFALFYHDIVYKATSSKNEEESAEIALKRLLEINADQPTIDLTVEIILATKQHDIAKNNDVNLFTDADLSILGASYEEYEHYYLSIRKEYKIYPTLMYKKGRTKVLQQFLAKKQVYNTVYFQDKYEKQAIENMIREIDVYSS